MAKGLTSNADDILRRMKARASGVKRELSVTARELGPLLNRDSKAEIQAEIYNVAIPLKKSADATLSKNAALRTKTTKGSRGKWSRTGNLKRSESWVVEGPVIVLRNNAEYAAARNALGAPNPPNKAGRKSGEQRAQAVPDAQKSKTKSVQWQSVVVIKNRDLILRKRREAVLRALSGAR